jgi:hypothetical protein
MTDDLRAFDPLALIRVLNEHEVSFVVIGGIAAGVQGAMWATFDLDVTYQRDPTNHRRLAAALAELEAQPVELEPGVTVRLDAEGLASGDVWMLATRFGRLDLLAVPAPGLAYTELESRARTIHGQEVYRVASLADLIVMKLSAGHPRDRAHVDLLRATQEELARDDDASPAPDLP